MNKIIFPLRTGMRGDGVADLQDGLFLLMEKGVIRLPAAEARPFVERMRAERAGATFGDLTRKLVAVFQEQHNLEPSGGVDERTAATLNRFIEELGSQGGQPAEAEQEFEVKGTVRYVNGFPARGLTVSAFDRDLRSEQLLGQAATDAKGLYLIKYVSRQFRKSEKGSADLVVKVTAPDGAQMVASEVLFNAPISAVVDLNIPVEARQTPSLFEQIQMMVDPLLEGLKVADLEEDGRTRDLTFLSGETGFDKALLARFVLAHKLAQISARYRLAPEFWFAPLGASFFEYAEDKSLQDQSASILESLTTLDSKAVNRALTRSINNREINPAFREKVAAWVEAFLSFAANRTVGESGRTIFVRLALEGAGIKDTSKQEKFARLFNEQKRLTPELLNALEKDQSFNKTEIADLHTSFRLQELTQADFSVVRMLKDGFGIRQPENIRLLAKKSESEFVELVRSKHAAGEIRLPVEVSAPAGQVKLPEAEFYGKTLERQFREAFPTTAFSGGLERALKNGGARGLRHAEAINGFLGEHESFELLNTPVDNFLSGNVRGRSERLARDEGFRLELKAVQRVFKLAPTFEATDALLADDLHSAQKIYRMGKSEFVRKYAGQQGFTAESASQAWNKAADTHAAALTIVTDLKALEADGLPLALQNGNEDVSKFPNWNNLFQTGDLCECEHCRSVLSPAAYFADLLMFLKERKAANPAHSVKDILFNRRPDLGYLELNCDNALTPLPYIDVVCEVLEDVIADGEKDVQLAGFAAMPADTTTAKTKVATALAAAKIELSADFSLTQVGTEDKWVAHGENATYLLKKKAPATNYFVEVLRNTKARADELRAYPQYINEKAYEKLRTAIYPLALPFDLFAEEVRAAIQKTNLQRWDLMRTMHGAAVPNNPSDGEIAAEYFGISVNPAAAHDEKRLILVANATVAGQQAVWGETGNAAWLNTVGNVKNFLQKTGLEYNDLLALLDLKFINPAGDIAINHLDNSCDTDKKVIQILDATKFDRIHRFLRLWRKLNGWKMWELDLVIRHKKIGNSSLDEAFLIKLMKFNELKKRLGNKVTVEQTCALLGNLNIETRFTRLHEKREDALYQKLFLNKRLINPLDPAFQLDPGTGELAAGATITAHLAVVQAALGVREADLLIFQKLTKASDDLPYINNDLNLANLSFLWRHAWLAKTLKFKAEDWVILLKTIDQDLNAFGSPQDALDFLDKAAGLKNCGFTIDELNWLLAADRNTKAAVKEPDAARFLFNLRKELQTIKSEFDPTQYDFLSTPTDEERLTALLTGLLQKLNRDDAGVNFFLGTLRGDATVEAAAPGLGAVTFPAGMPIKYTGQTLRFTGVMTAAQKTTLLTDASLAAVTGNVDYQKAVAELFSAPRLAVKFYEPVFTTQLETLPPSIDFKAQLSADLAAKITYDAEQRMLQCRGILSLDDQKNLNALSPDPVWQNAVSILAAQPQTIVPPDERIWLTDTDLDTSIPANNTFAKRLANGANKALGYLSKTLSQNSVVEQCSEKLGLTAALSREMLTGFVLVPPDNILEFFTGTFSSTNGAVDYTGFKDAFDTWYWLNRVAAILKKWKVSLDEFETLLVLQTSAKLLDFKSLPLDSAAPIATLPEFLRTKMLLKLRDTLPETGITLLEVLEKLHDAAYATKADFAADVELINEDWSAADVEKIIALIDLAYPADYLLAESWERLRRVFYFLDNLNAGADTAALFAAATMTEGHAKTLKELLRSKFGAETWLSLCAEIQDALRERKRDALAAYLLTQPMPADAPSGKWENTNDLYAYYLLDVEMSSCQLTSRLVQGSGSIQLFVQRCFMGLEPDVAVIDSGDKADTAWRWWKWMRKYRVWEANRKVFLWPENWIEPELKKDRSQFFKDLENELTQNEVNQYTVETAFLNYLEKLEGVAQLEIAGFYQEDDGDDTIIHTFGRTTGAEPHLYYYRRYDYRQWTPWEKVEMDIQGDYLIPAVVNKRLFLFWPVFTEVPDEEGNNSVSTPDTNQSNVKLEKAKKKLRLQMAVSEYRQGKWTPKRVSKDIRESSSYDVEIIRKHYRFFPIDRSEIDGRFGIKFDGNSTGGSQSSPTNVAYLSGSFEIAGCKGVPELGSIPGYFRPALRPELISTGDKTTFLKWVELESHNIPAENDFTLENLQYFQSGYANPVTLLEQTPWIFKMTPPWHLSYLDKLWLDGLLALPANLAKDRSSTSGSWLPFFYNDRKRTFFVLPSPFTLKTKDLPPGLWNGPRIYYPEVKAAFRALDLYIEGLVQTWLDKVDLSKLTAAERAAAEQFLSSQFAEMPLPPYTDDQLKDLIKRWYMRFYHLFLGAWGLFFYQFRQFHFKNYYHPFVCDFAKLVYNPLKGIPALMSRETQLKDSGFSFKQSYKPTLGVVEPLNENSYPKEVVDFTPDGAYSPYNWELFFHAPLLIANSLSRNQRFEEAREWYHFIFNPLGLESITPGGSPMSKYWITKPFYETTDKQYIQQRIENILLMLAGDTSVPGSSPEAKTELEKQVLDWRRNPFEPHRIANYRTVAYQKTVVMKYLDNLIAWGDNLFRQDSMESINEATQLYILAAEILGPRPRKVPPRVKPPIDSFNELEDQLDKFSNALVEVENLVPVMPGNKQNGEDSAPLPMLYFCIPRNDKMLGYWDTVADRLYKIRHCMNIEGVVRQLALFEPPIDPGALVKAVAGGVDIGAALADLNAPLPLYRFSTLLQKANEVCSDVKALGGALLTALEKKDAEAIGLLRQDQEIRLLNAVKELRKQQIDEAKENLTGIKRTREMTEIRKKYYESREFMNAGETVAIALNTASTIIDTGVAVGYALAGGLKLIPNFIVGASGFGGSPHAVVDTGGASFGSSAEDLVKTLESISRSLDKMASIAGTLGSYHRRQDDWDFQKDLAVKELTQIDSQIASAELRIAMAEKELDNHIIQIENAKATEEFMRSKYTNEELYQWQIGQISGVYFQSYKLAFDLAKRAERSFRFELGLQDSSYINFGYWDSLKKGLLSGEKLQYDLRRLESAHIEQNRREFEMTKHISVALLDPLALVKLRETGRCFLNLPEEIFDLDYPGHYFRRIKSVSMTLPCVAGPYTTISCTLRLLKNGIRINTASGDNGYPRNTDDAGLPADDVRFVENNIPVKAIAASSAQNDSGMFELNFRDERYLPFEGAGAISQWSLELFNDLPSNNPDFGKPLRQFDFSTISDAILHVKYTAREDAGPFKNSAVNNLREYFGEEDSTHSMRLINLRQEFPTQWHRFLHPVNPANGNVFELEMSADLFTTRDRQKTLKINVITLLARCTDGGNYKVVMSPPLPAPPPPLSDTMTLATLAQYGGLHFNQKDVSSAPIEIAPTDAPVIWPLKMTRPGGGNLQEDPLKKVMEVEDLLLVLGYEWELT
ncbi:MAG: hypothetical protein IPG76_08100 [Acidobacteria bacterium]|nr:hypothetical protein [Acidobacteriota bacterium]